MSMKWTLASVAAMAMAGLGVSVGAQQGKGFLPYEDRGAIQRGEVIYAENCASCHGANLEGEPDWRIPDEDGLMKAPPHDASGHTWHHPDMQLFMITKYGTAKIVGNGYESRMPGFEDVLSDADIVEVLAYIKSTWPKRVVKMHNERNG
ncbi:cytochrome c [Pelagimonas sp. KU-00592-HH]|jgi:mono/diheme cytochrome c family protein|uniref:c-type cytochrome n=1 Tax=Pelagimonas sp. KU-00592-HH TaxID=3127651 RepID=UPI0031051DF6